MDGVELWVYSLQAYFNRWVGLAVHCADIIFPVYLAAPSILVAAKGERFPRSVMLIHELVRIYSVTYPSKMNDHSFFGLAQDS